VFDRSQNAKNTCERKLLNKKVYEKQIDKNMAYFVPPLKLHYFFIEGASNEDYH